MVWPDAVDHDSSHQNEAGKVTSLEVDDLNFFTSQSATVRREKMQMTNQAGGDPD
jgi:hypothetical protein